MEKTNVPVIDHLGECHEVQERDHNTYADSKYHYIDSLRQYLMCGADDVLLTFEWIPDFPGPWPNVEAEHQCIDWDEVHNWSKQQSVDTYDSKILVNPRLHLG
jgi:hypothetical protein